MSEVTAQMPPDVVPSDSNGGPSHVSLLHGAPLEREGAAHDPMARTHPIVTHGYRLVALLLGLSGLRLDRPRAGAIAAWFALLIGAYLVTAANDLTLTVGCFVASWVFYYVGNTAVLGTRIRAASIRRHGARAAFERYEGLLGAMFAAQGLGLGVMASLDHPQWMLPVPEALCIVGGAALVAIGTFVRLWAALHIGLDGVYCRDLFLREPSGGDLGGPYRWLANPMYGLGQLHAWGFALISHSLLGLIAAALCHAAIYAFYFAVERPFVLSAYPRARRAVELAR